MHEVKLAQVADRVAMQRCFGIVKTGLRRIGMAPAFRVVQGGGVGAGHDGNNIYAVAGVQNLTSRAANPSLSPCPRNLYDLWTEYSVGLGGGSPHLRFHTVNAENQSTSFSSQCNLESGEVVSGFGHYF